MGVEFKSSLLREKFTLSDPADPDAEPLVALSNRMVVPLTSKYESENETFVIRTQNMHSCARFAGAIAKEYMERGPITSRVTPFDWGRLWHDVTKGYEKDWNPNIWAAIYYKGRVVFEEGERHPLIDIIEKCDAANHEDYSQSVAFAESAFQAAGKKMSIDHDSNIALIVAVTEDEAKCGVILRAANRKTTFNYTVKKRKGGDPVRVPTILTVAAAFLEGVQLAFGVGMANRKRELELLEKYSDEDRKGRRGAERLVNLTNAIETLERRYLVQYRPERPDFARMVTDAENFAMKILKPQIEEKIANGEITGREWIN